MYKKQHAEPLDTDSKDASRAEYWLNMYKTQHAESLDIDSNFVVN
jgi:hypothetical protein